MPRPHPPGAEGYTLAGRGGGRHSWVPLGAFPRAPVAQWCRLPGAPGRLHEKGQQPEGVTARWLRDAALAVVRGHHVATTETPAVGCSVTWRA